ncbi:hypothetical protein [Arthrobacter sp. NA-172]|uniref:hypothetical protein n=1 Tax=Arthrobacter sp. NA-172 TaxID=3367524 RepID=UPI0037553EC6
MSSITGYTKQKIDSMLAGVPILWAPNTFYAATALAVSPNGDVVSRITPGTSPATYAADAANWALSTTYAPANAASTITRDSRGVVTGITEAGIAETYTRDSAGRVTAVTRAGITKTISRDSAGRVTGVA